MTGFAGIINLMKQETSLISLSPGCAERLAAEFPLIRIMVHRVHPAGGNVQGRVRPVFQIVLSFTKSSHGYDRVFTCASLSFSLQQPLFQ